MVQWGLWFLAMAAIMGWLSRARMRAPEAGDGVLSHPRGILVVGLVTTFFFAALAVLSAVFPGRNPSRIPTILFLVFVLMGLVVILDYYNGRHTLTPEGLRYGKLWGGGGVARWDEVRSLRYSESARWFRIELADGRVVRVSAMLQGLPRFAAEALSRLPTSVVDEESRRVLEAAASGQLPGIWG